MDTNGSTGNDIDAVLRQAELAENAESACWHARRAMRLDDHRPEPHTLLGDWQDDTSRAEDHYRRAMELASRPPTASNTSYSSAYLSATMGLIGVLARTGRSAELIDHGREALRIDPEDRRGLRADLVGPLIECGYYDEAQALLARYADHERAFAATMSDFACEDRDSTAYARALLAFAGSGDTEAARSIWGGRSPHP